MGPHPNPNIKEGSYIHSNIAKYFHDVFHLCPAVAAYPTTIWPPDSWVASPRTPQGHSNLPISMGGIIQRQVRRRREARLTGMDEVTSCGRSQMGGGAGFISSGIWRRGGQNRRIGRWSGRREDNGMGGG